MEDSSGSAALGDAESPKGAESGCAHQWGVRRDAADEPLYEVCVLCGKPRDTEGAVEAFMREHYTCHDPECAASHVDMSALPDVTFTETFTHPGMDPELQADATVGEWDGGEDDGPAPE